jgi:hypothetical protein
MRYEPVQECGGYESVQDYGGLTSDTEIQSMKRIRPRKE